MKRKERKNQFVLDVTGDDGIQKLRKQAAKKQNRKQRRIVHQILNQVLGNVGPDTEIDLFSLEK